MNEYLRVGQKIKANVYGEIYEGVVVGVAEQKVVIHKNDVKNLKNNQIVILNLNNVGSISIKIKDI